MPAISRGAATTPSDLRSRALAEVRDALLDWMAQASELPEAEVRPSFRWLCEAKGFSFDEPTPEGLAGVLESLRVMALRGGSAREPVDAALAPFRAALAAL